MFNFFKPQESQISKNERNYQKNEEETRAKKESKEAQVGRALREADAVIANVTKEIIAEVAARNRNILKQITEHKSDDFTPDLCIKKFKYGDILEINQNQLNPNIDLQNPHIGNAVLQIPIPTIVGFEVLENNDIEKTLSYDAGYFIDYAHISSSIYCSIFVQGEERYINAVRKIKEQLITICGSYESLKQELRKSDDVFYTKSYRDIIKSRKVSYISDIYPNILKIKTIYDGEYKIYYYNFNEAELLATLNHIWRTGKL